MLPQALPQYSIANGIKW